MELIDDDELEAREEPAPTRVMRKDARVQHVRVRHHDVARLADRGATSGRGVAVVGVDSYVNGKSVLERAQLGELVLRERLRRGHIQHAALRTLEPSRERE